MASVTLSKPEYETLKKKAKAYEELAGLFFKKVKTEPINEIINDFAKTSLYSKAFLRDLRAGLQNSSKAKR